MFKKIILLTAAVIQFSLALNDASLPNREIFLPADAKCMTKYGLDSVTGLWNEISFSDIECSDTLNGKLFSTRAPNPGGGTVSYKTIYKDNLMIANYHSFVVKGYYVHKRRDFEYNSDGLKVRIQKSISKPGNFLDSLTLKSYNSDGRSESDTLIITLRNGIYGGNLKTTIDTLSISYTYSKSGVLEKRSYTNLSDSTDFGEDRYQYQSLGLSSVTIVETFISDDSGKLPKSPVSSDKYVYEMNGSSIEYDSSKILLSLDAKKRVGARIVSKLDGIEYKDFAKSIFDFEGTPVSKPNLTHKRKSFIKMDGKELRYSLTESPNQSSRIQIFNSLGRAVKTVSISGRDGSISLEDISSGLYFVKFTGTNSTEMSYKIRL